jgi:hypothetical protein
MAMLLALSAATLDVASVAVRNAASLQLRSQAFHAAEAGLAACERMLAGDRDLALAWPGPGEPRRWRWRGMFDGPQRQAFELPGEWRLPARAPQCLIERWKIAARPGALAYLITVRGFASLQTAQVWLQRYRLEQGHVVERRWRSLAGRPR